MKNDLSYICDDRNNEIEGILKNIFKIDIDYLWKETMDTNKYMYENRCCDLELFLRQLELRVFISINKFFPDIKKIFSKLNGCEVQMVEKVLYKYVCNTIDSELHVAKDFSIEYILFAEANLKYIKFDADIIPDEKMRKKIVEDKLELDEADKSIIDYVRKKNNAAFHLINNSNKYNKFKELGLYTYNDENERNEKIKIEKNTANNFMFALNNWSRNPYSEKASAYEYRNVKEFIGSFLDTQFQLDDLYYFEKIYKANLLMNLEFLDIYSGFRFRDEEERIWVIDCMSLLSDLDNTLDIDGLIIQLSIIYKNVYRDLKNGQELFQNGVIELLKELKTFFIPLYKIVFSYILHHNINDEEYKLKDWIYELMEKNINISFYKTKYKAIIESKEDMQVYFSNLYLDFKFENMDKDKIKMVIEDRFKREKIDESEFSQVYINMIESTNKYCDYYEKIIDISECLLPLSNKIKDKYESELFENNEDVDILKTFIISIIEKI